MTRIRLKNRWWGSHCDTAVILRRLYGVDFVDSLVSAMISRSTGFQAKIRRWGLIDWKLLIRHVVRLSYMIMLTTNWKSLFHCGIWCLSGIFTKLGDDDQETDDSGNPMRSSLRVSKTKERRPFGEKLVRIQMQFESRENRVEKWSMLCRGWIERHKNT